MKLTKRYIRPFLQFRQLFLLAWRAQPLCLTLLLAIQLVQGVVPVATGYISKELFDTLTHVFQGTPFSLIAQGLVVLLVVQAVLSMMGQLTTPLQNYLQAELERHLSLSLRSTLYQKLNGLGGLAHFEDPRLQDTLRMTSSHVQFVPLQAVQLLNDGVQNSVTLVSFFALLLALSPWLALVLSIAVLPYLIVNLKLNQQQFSLLIQNTPQERRASYYGQVLSWLPFAKEVRLFHLGDYFLRRFSDTTRQINAAQRTFQLRELRWQGLLSLLSGAVAVGAFVVVVLQAFARHISVGDMALYVQAVESVQASLMILVFALKQMNQDLLFFQQYETVLSLQDCIARPSSPRAIPPLRDGITFRDVSFRYSEHHPWTLRHLNLFLPAGSTVALVGLNGAGKTTLVKLLTRLYDPSAGEILWDGIDIREFTPEAYRQHLGTIFQDFVRYELSAQENIGVGQTEQMENLAAIEEAAKKAGMHERIKALPHGYSSMLSRWMAEEGGNEDEDNGIDLSGGEWQKLALARMLLRDCPVLILDEPSASLDAQTEYELFTHFQALVRNHTSLLISHRFNTVRKADVIAVLEQGKISELGSHTELMELAGTYARLYKMQAESYQSDGDQRADASVGSTNMA